MDFVPAGVQSAAPNTFQIALSAIKFFFEYTLQHQWATLLIFCV
jgi:hypothetical protein